MDKLLKILAAATPQLAAASALVEVVTGIITTLNTEGRTEMTPEEQELINNAVQRRHHANDDYQAFLAGN